jgi:phosphinothricin acetyltransferase
VIVRDAAPGDLHAVAAIYADAVRDGYATFDLEPRPLAFWHDALAACDPGLGHWFLVACDGNTVLGYARSTRHKDRPAYDVTVETSAYVDAAARGRGVGNALYAELFGRLDASGRRLAVAGVALPNDASERLHRAHGFTEVGVFRGIGVKFGRAWDVRWYQRPLRGAPPVPDGSASDRPSPSRNPRG